MATQTAKVALEFAPVTHSSSYIRPHRRRRSIYGLCCVDVDATGPAMPVDRITQADLGFRSRCPWRYRSASRLRPEWRFGSPGVGGVPGAAIVTDRLDAVGADRGPACHR